MYLYMYAHQYKIKWSGKYNGEREGKKRHEFINVSYDDCVGKHENKYVVHENTMGRIVGICG